MPATRPPPLLFHSRHTQSKSRFRESRKRMNHEEHTLGWVMGSFSKLRPEYRVTRSTHAHSHARSCFLRAEGVAISDKESDNRETEPFSFIIHSGIRNRNIVWVGASGKGRDVWLFPASFFFPNGKRGIIVGSAFQPIMCLQETCEGQRLKKKRGGGDRIMISSLGPFASLPVSHYSVRRRRITE